MEEILKLDPIMKVGGSVDLPGSKSISNRALLLAALSEGTTELNNLLVAEDTEMMIGALETLGVKLEVSNDGTEVKVEGCGGNFPVKKADLFLGNAGTAMRPLSSSLAFSGGEYVPLERSIQDVDLVDPGCGNGLDGPGHGFTLDDQAEPVPVPLGHLLRIVEQRVVKIGRKDHRSGEYRPGQTPPAGLVATGLPKLVLVLVF